MNPHEPTRTQVQAFKEGPKPFPCLPLLAIAAALVLAGLAIGLMIP